MMRDRQWVNRDPEFLGLEQPPKYGLVSKIEAFLMGIQLYEKPVEKVLVV